MTPPVLLAPPSTSDTDPPNAAADCAKRNPNVALPPFGLIIPTHPHRSEPSSTSTSTTPTSASSDAYDRDASRTNHFLARQWTGVPIRAIIPLPRRKLVSNGALQTQSLAHASDGNSDTAVGPPYLMRFAQFPDDADTDTDTDSGAEFEEEGSDEGEDAPLGSRCCSYESITAVEGLAAWSFEELRVECYAQSLVARGTKPPPVIQRSLAIPPAFVPRIVPRS